MGDKSLNRCTEASTTVDLQSFQIGKSTPALENDCAGPHFFLSEAEPVAVPLGPIGPPMKDSSILAELTG